VSSTIRNMTVHTTDQHPSHGKSPRMFGLTIHASNVGIRRPPSEQLDHSASKGPDVRFGRGSFELNDLRGHPIGSTCDILYLPLHRAQVQGDTKV